MHWKSKNNEIIVIIVYNINIWNKGNQGGLDNGSTA